jgi:hypothetical protein
VRIRDRQVVAGPGRTRASSIWRHRERQLSSKAIESGTGAVLRSGTAVTPLPRRLFHEVSHGLPSGLKLRLAIGHLVPERHIPGCRVIPSSASAVPRTRASRRCSQTSRATRGPCTLVAASFIDRAQSLPGVHDRNRGSSAFRMAAGPRCPFPLTYFERRTLPIGCARSATAASTRAAPGPSAARSGPAWRAATG